MPRICTRVALAAVFTAAIVSAQRGAPIPQQLVFTPYHASGIYDVGEGSIETRGSNSIWSGTSVRLAQCLRKSASTCSRSATEETRNILARSEAA